MITIRTRNIKLNVFLNEDEQKILKEKSNKAGLSQSDFIRMLIKNFTETSETKIDVYNIITATILSTIDDLTKLKIKMQKLAYYQIVEFLDKIVVNLKALITKISS